MPFSTPFHKQLDPSKQAGQVHPGRVEHENLALRQAIARAKAAQCELQAGTTEDWEAVNDVSEAELAEFARGYL